MYCKYCGHEISADSLFCPKCGKSLDSYTKDIIDDYTQSAYNPNTIHSAEKKGLSITSLILGILGLIVWLLPIIGFPIIIVGLVLGICGRNKGGKGMATAGIVLCIITLILTTANSAIGAYKGYHGQLPFQQNNNESSRNSREHTTNVFTLRDKDGNILMEGGIASATTSLVTDQNGLTNYVVEINFTDTASKKFATITNEHIGECIGIYLNDDMLANPMVQCSITGGTCQITNLSNHQEALDLVEKLNSTID